MIPVVDVFAGPGGLGEGFHNSLDSRGEQRFKLSLSIEKDAFAHRTLTLRALKRTFADEVPLAYDRFLRGEIGWNDLRDGLVHPFQIADAEARRIELGPDTVASVRDLIRRAVSPDNPWVLIGGPPCQAYSLAGRARNRGVEGYDAATDHRQTLYVEYLQILADHAPPVFVMENVKGLLSARLESQHLFQRIVDDLSDPSVALKREGRGSVASRCRYEVRPIVQSAGLFADDPKDYVVRAEEYGIPQRRHRVILVGVRSDVGRDVGVLTPGTRPATVRQALHGLPRVRSGISTGTDSEDAWMATLARMGQSAWYGNGIGVNVRKAIRQALDRATRPAERRGAEFIERDGEPILNHSTRSHIPADLERYMFASAFAKVESRSPTLGDFPRALLPQHSNVAQSLLSGMFSDRFRVQLAGAPSTTITSHISKDGHYYIHHDPTQCRSLTVREAARLQTFPDDYFFCGPRTSQYHQVGNAVPPELARQIAHAVAPALGT